jgi:hypothetical protein
MKSKSAEWYLAQCTHDGDCEIARWHRNGMYREMAGGQGQRKPEPPVCTCGLDDLRERFAKLKTDGLGVGAAFNGSS